MNRWVASCCASCNEDELSSVGYPIDYGFIPDTVSADGDPLEALVIVSEPTFPGCAIAVKSIALVRLRDEDALDEKLLCVPLTDPHWNHLERLADVPDRLRDEIERLFRTHHTPPGTPAHVEGWLGRDAALDAIDRAAGRWAEKVDGRG